jgi:hypothetical protein
MVGLGFFLVNLLGVMSVNSRKDPEQ